MFMNLWSVEELGDFLRVPRTFIYERTRENGPELIPHIKLGKYVRFNPESADFKTWLSSHVVGSDTQQAFQTAETRHSK